MANIAKPILLAVIGILAVVLFLQTSNLITGQLLGNETLATTQTSTTNIAPTIFDVNFTMTSVPETACGNDATTITCSGLVYDANGVANVSLVNASLYTETLGEAGCDNAKVKSILMSDDYHFPILIVSFAPIVLIFLLHLMYLIYSLVLNSLLRLVLQWLQLIHRQIRSLF